MDDQITLTETIEALEKELSLFADKNKPLHEIVSINGNILVNIGEHVEAWLLDKYCYIIEDNEVVAAFNHNDKEDFKLMEHACLLYHKSIAPSRVKH